MNETLATTITSLRRGMTFGALGTLAILVGCGQFGEDEQPAVPEPVDRPSVQESLPELPARFKDCDASWDGGEHGVPGSVVIFRAGVIERVSTEEAWAPLAFFGGSETTTDDHWILGSCTKPLDVGFDGVEKTKQQLF